jgi:hypothetical protein
MVDITRVVAAVEVAYKVLAARVLAFLALGMTFGLFAWAMYLATWLHFSIAGAFGVCIFLPVLWHAKPSVHVGEGDV